MTLHGLQTGTLKKRSGIRGRILMSRGALQRLEREKKGNLLNQEVVCVCQCGCMLLHNRSARCSATDDKMELCLKDSSYLILLGMNDLLWLSAS